MQKTAINNVMTIIRSVEYTNEHRITSAESIEKLVPENSSLFSCDSRPQQKNCSLIGRPSKISAIPIVLGKVAGEIGKSVVVMLAVFVAISRWCLVTAVDVVVAVKFVGSIVDVLKSQYSLNFLSGGGWIQIHWLGGQLIVFSELHVLLSRHL